MAVISEAHGIENMTFNEIIDNKGIREIECDF